MTTNAGPAVHMALVYESSAALNQWFEGLVAELRQSGKQLAGLVQRDAPREGRSRCDMVLHELATGQAVVISEDLGESATSCRLSPGRLVEAAQLVEAQLADADVVFLNKFGKAEADGRGFRDLIAQCLDRGKSIVIGVPRANEAKWQEFCGGLFTSLPVSEAPEARAVHAVAARF